MSVSAKGCMKCATMCDSAVWWSCHILTVLVWGLEVGHMDFGEAVKNEVSEGLVDIGGSMFIFWGCHRNVEFKKTSVSLDNFWFCELQVH